MSKLAARIKVIATSAVTWLTFAAATTPLVAGEIADQLPADVAEDVVRWGGAGAGWLLAAVAIIRIVLVAPKDQRGILPTPLGDLNAEQIAAAGAALRYLEQHPDLNVDDLLTAVISIRPTKEP